MPELIIKYKGAKTLRALNDFAKYFDFTIEKPKPKKANAKEAKESNIHIEFAEDPDVTALAGIWKDKDITLEDIRKRAWGSRI
jgi:hypothetical protein